MKVKGFIILPLLFSLTAMADEVPVFEITIQDHRFQPAEITVQAHRKFRLRVTNKDSIPEEFESYELNREKIITGGGQAVIYIGPLPPGRYPFFGEFHPKTAKGVIVVK